MFSQLVHEQGFPDADKIILSDEIREELFFAAEMTDSMRYAFFNIPGNSTFAAAREVNYNPHNSGKIVDSGSGDLVWYMAIRSGNARSLNIIFSTFDLREGEKVYVYDDSMLSVKGPFTHLNNKQGRGLAVMPVPGQEIIIEYHMSDPTGSDRLVVGQVAHDFIGVAGTIYSKDGFYGDSQSCNVDINCESGNDWQLEKNAVVRIIAGGTELGSGFLVNNTNGENIPYVISANHVIKSEQHALNSVYVFRYESPYCDGPDGSIDYSLSGAELMAADENTDFTIVRLDDFPPINYKPYFAGWDVSGTVPDSTVTIHHPSGDVKKITTDGDPPVIDTFQDMYEDGFWKVLQWDEGTTEGGSSGSPLFDQNHRVVGLLTGGEAVCGTSVNDYYSRLDITYDLYEEQHRSLMPWLDPARSGVSVLDGRDPYADNRSEFDTLCNCAGDERFITEYDLPGTGFTTGFNSDSLVMYAEKFTVVPGLELTELVFETAEVNFINSTDSITVYIMSGITEPESTLARRTFKIIDARDFNDLYFDFVDPVPLPEGFFVAWHLWYRDNAQAEQQQFAVFHGAPVDISKNTAWFKDIISWHPFYEHPYLTDPLNMCLKVITATNTVYNDIDKAYPAHQSIMSVYPNPASAWLRIKIINDIPGPAKYAVIDNSARIMMKGSFYSTGAGYIHELDVSGLLPGVYYINIDGPGGSSTDKVIIR
ncbi:MAG: trypsin-like peptidase domain-containing protein [Bacteroidales bacterium]|nr:trypsin-like peptidase domain-containing protein [Bacteroidales bacterium]